MKIEKCRAPDCTKSFGDGSGRIRHEIAAHGINLSGRQRKNSECLPKQRKSRKECVPHSTPPRPSINEPTPSLFKQEPPDSLVHTVASSPAHTYAPLSKFFTYTSDSNSSCAPATPAYFPSSFSKDYTPSFQALAPTVHPDASMTTASAFDSTFAQRSHWPSGVSQPFASSSSFGLAPIVSGPSIAGTIWDGITYCQLTEGGQSNFPQSYPTYAPSSSIRSSSVPSAWFTTGMPSLELAGSLSAYDSHVGHEPFDASYRAGPAMVNGLSPNFNMDMWPTFVDNELATMMGTSQAGHAAI